MKLFIPLDALSLAFVKQEPDSLRYECENYTSSDISFCFTTTDTNSIEKIKEQLTQFEDNLLKNFENKTYILKNYHLELGKRYFCSCYEIQENNALFFIQFDMLNK
jgi:hypothetical protein